MLRCSFDSLLAMLINHLRRSSTFLGLACVSGRLLSNSRSTALIANLRPPCCGFCNGYSRLLANSVSDPYRRRPATELVHSIHPFYSLRVPRSILRNILALYIRREVARPELEDRPANGQSGTNFCHRSTWKYADLGTKTGV